MLLTGRDREFVLLQLSVDNRTAVLDLAEGVAAVLALLQISPAVWTPVRIRSPPKTIEPEVREARKSITSRKRS